MFGANKSSHLGLIYTVFHVSSMFMHTELFDDCSSHSDAVKIYIVTLRLM